jgi:hypothetical protein
MSGRTPWEVDVLLAEALIEAVEGRPGRALAEARALVKVGAERAARDPQNLGQVAPKPQPPMGVTLTNRLLDGASDPPRERPIVSGTNAAFDRQAMGE